MNYNIHILLLALISSINHVSCVQKLNDLDKTTLPKAPKQVLVPKEQLKPTPVLSGDKPQSFRSLTSFEMKGDSQSGVKSTFDAREISSSDILLKKTEPDMKMPQFEARDIAEDASVAKKSTLDISSAIPRIDDYEVIDHSRRPLSKYGATFPVPLEKLESAEKLSTVDKQVQAPSDYFMQDASKIEEVEAVNKSRFSNLEKAGMIGGALAGAGLLAGLGYGIYDLVDEDGNPISEEEILSNPDDYELVEEADAGFVEGENVFSDYETIE